MPKHNINWEEYYYLRICEITFLKTPSISRARLNENNTDT
jgi:hypothetical protein